MMRTKALVAGVLALAIAAAPAMAQAPSFAGSWTLVPDPNAAGGGGGGGRGGGFLGQAATVSQDAKTLTITRTTQNGEVKMVFNLDGTESKNTVQGRGGQMEQVSTAKWDGAKLVITTNSQMGGNPVTQTRTLSLDASGQLVVTTTGPGRGGEVMTTTQTYKKG